MLQQVQNHAARIVMGVAFYLFGFFVVANALDLADREIVMTESFYTSSSSICKH